MLDGIQTVDVVFCGIYAVTDGFRFLDSTRRLFEVLVGGLLVQAGKRANFVVKVEELVAQLLPFLAHPGVDKR